MISSYQLNSLFGVNMKSSFFKCQAFMPLTYACRHLKSTVSLASLGPSSKTLDGTMGIIIINNKSSFRRLAHTEPNPSSRKSTSSLAEVKGTTAGSVTIGEKVKQTTIKDVYYTGIIIGGVTVTGIIFYTIFKELFSRETPNGIYSEAFKICKNNPKIVDTLGEPIKGHGETTTRGRRRHVSHIEFEQDGVKCMRMRFYIQGVRRRGTVHLEVKKNDKNKYEYRYLFVELDGYPTETIILEDNR